MKTDWEGYYLDGRSAARHRVAIRLMRSGLEVTTEAGTLWWPYPEIRQTQGFYAGEEVRLERGGEIPEALLVSDAAFLTALHRVAPELATRFHDPARRRMRAKLTLVAALAVIGITTALYLWGIPAIAGIVASQVPASWEEGLGEAVVENLAPAPKRCTDPTLTRAVEEITITLTRTLPSSHYTFRVMVVDNPTVNAIAAPGGFIVLFRGLVERTQTPEELAGVLAHEVQHILKRHATRLLVQNASTGLLVAALTGDASGAMRFGLEGARILGILRYSRGYEEEADVEGMRMLIAARIDPAGLVRFFESLKEKEEGREIPAFLTYLSTHPSTAGRVERLKSLAAQADGQWITLLPDLQWREITQICHAGGE
ncbi:MAG: putative peptidase [candidate division NC10 bacterium CSP1-5]|nr:MAG: putative peptidase [candidate division NC10 bacterium CSP1-5]